MLRFYEVDERYANYLRNYEHKVPYIAYSGNNKFVCGVVLTCNNLNYFAPVSSKVGAKERTEVHIRDENNNKISSIRFQFMFPVPASALTVMDFSKVQQTDPSYAALLRKEFNYCRQHEKDIKHKASYVYGIGISDSHKLKPYCCDFKLLEEKMSEYCK